MMGIISFFFICNLIVNKKVSLHLSTIWIYKSAYQ